MDAPEVWHWGNLACARVIAAAVAAAQSACQALSAQPATSVVEVTPLCASFCQRLLLKWAAGINGLRKPARPSLLLAGLLLQQQMVNHTTAKSEMHQAMRLCQRSACPAYAAACRINMLSDCAGKHTQSTPAPGARDERRHAAKACS